MEILLAEGTTANEKAVLAAPMLFGQHL